MALLDIVIEGYQVEMEEFRGDIGVLTDIVVDNENESLMEIPQVVGAGGEFGYGFVG